MDDFLTVFGTSNIFGIEQILTSLLLSFVLSSVYATVYRWTFQGLSYSRSFVHTMVLGSMVVCMLIIAIGNNLARGLGILGTLAIIRFRTPVRDPRDMVFLFASLGVGIACGAATYGVGIIGTLTISAAALILHWSPYASRREYEGLLRFILPAHAVNEDDVIAVLQECCIAFHLIAMREAVQGEMVEYSYQVRLIDPSYQSELIEKLSAIDELTDANLLMQRTTVEL
ncbi:MAG: DUF4956 domain-containing protein [Verrucomicrobia bacterium]|nr:DUF4956 domain-containing protein [Verrucomicrobiota bacterium]